MLTLAVDTSGKTASCAVMQDWLLLGSRIIYTARAHSQILLPMVKQMLADVGKTVQDVDVFAAANGPGSYTGLRIGIAAVQALAFAGDKKCVGVSTLEGMAWNLSAHTGTICSCLAARQDLCYCAFFESDGVQVTRLTEDKVLHTEDIAAQIGQYGDNVMLAGDGVPVLEEELNLAPNELMKAPPHLFHQSACGVALAALHKEAVPPAELAVSYLQAVKIG